MTVSLTLFADLLNRVADIQKTITATGSDGAALAVLDAMPRIGVSPQGEFPIFFNRIGRTTYDRARGQPLWGIQTRVIMRLLAGPFAANAYNGEVEDVLNAFLAPVFATFAGLPKLTYQSQDFRYLEAGTPCYPLDHSGTTVYLYGDGTPGRTGGYIGTEFTLAVNLLVQQGRLA